MLKKWIALIAAALVLLTVPALAETKLTVNGTGTAVIDADQAIVSLGVSVRNSEVSKAQSGANEIIAKIREALREYGIPDEDISTGYMNIYAIYDYREEGEILTGYNASSTLSIRVTDPAKAGSVIDIAISAGANSLNGITFTATDTEEAESQALKAAFEDARRKAETLAEAGALQITGLESIQEVSTYSSRDDYGYYAKEAAGEEPAGDIPTSVQAAKITVTVQVSATWTAEGAAAR